MKIICLEFKGLGPYKNIVKLTFPDSFILLEGGNDSGKSSILDAISWVLFDETLKGDKKSEFINDFSSPGYGKIEIQDNDNKYVIYRERDKKNKVIAEVSINGVNQVERSTSGIQNIIEKDILGFDFKIFRNSNMFGQDDILLLASGTDAEKKKILADILDFDELDSMLKVCRGKISVANTELSSYKSNIESQETKRDTLYSEIQEFGKETINIDALNIELESVLKDKDTIVSPKHISDVVRKRYLLSKQAELSKKSVDIKTNLKNVYRDISQLDSDNIETYKVEIDALSKSLSDISGNMTSLQRDITNIDTNLNKFSKLSGGKCPTCYQDVPDTHKDNVISEWNNVKRTNTERLSAFDIQKQETIKSLDSFKKEFDTLQSLSNALNTLEEQDNLVQKEMDNITNELTNLDVDAAYDIDSATKKMESLKLKERELRNKIDTFKLQEGIISEKKRLLTEVDTDISKLIVLQKDVEKKLYHLKYVESIYDNKGVRHDMLTAFLPIFENYVNIYLNKIFPHLDVIGSTVTEGRTVLKMELEFKIHNKLTGLIRNFSSWSGGQKKVIALVMRFALTKASNIFKKSLNILFLDEIFGCLGEDNRQRVIDFLKEYQRENSMPIVVISHIEGTKDFFDKVYTVESEPGKGSFVRGI